MPKENDLESSKNNESESGAPELKTENKESIFGAGGDSAGKISSPKEGLLMVKMRKNNGFSIDVRNKKKENDKGSSLIFTETTNSGYVNTDNIIDWNSWATKQGAKRSGSYTTFDPSIPSQEKAFQTIKSYFSKLQAHSLSGGKSAFRHDEVDNLKDERNYSKVLFIKNGEFALAIDPKRKFFSGYEISDSEKSTAKIFNSHDKLENCDAVVLRFKNALDKTEGDYVSGDILLNNGAYIVSESGLSIYNMSEEDSREVTGQPIFTEAGHFDFFVFQNPKKKNDVYFCKQRMVGEIKTVSIDKSKKQDAKELDLLTTFHKIDNIMFDPSGDFLVVEADSKVTFIHWSTKKIVGELPDLQGITFGPEGKFYSKEPDDRGGYKGIFSQDINLDELGEYFRKVWEDALMKAVEGGATGDEMEATAISEINKESFKELDGIKKKMDEASLSQLESLVDFQGLEKQRIFLAGQEKLLSTGYDSRQIAFIMQDINKNFSKKEKEIVSTFFEKLTQDLKEKVVGKTDVSLESLSSFSRELEEIYKKRGLLSQDQRNILGEVRESLGDALDLYFKDRKGEFEEDLKDLSSKALDDIGSLTSIESLHDWRIYDLPSIRERINAILENIPKDQVDIIKIVNNSIQKIRTEVKKAENSFLKETTDVEKDQDSANQALIDQTKLDVDDFLEGLLRESFSDIYDFQRHLLDSPALTSLKNQITSFAIERPDVEKVASKYLEDGTSRVRNQVMRMQQTETRDGGQYIMFGDISFPIFDKEKVQRDPVELALTFISNQDGGGSDLGDVGFSIRKPDGSTEQMLLFESELDRDNWRYGVYSYRGELIPPTMMSVADFRDLNGNYIDWSKGDASQIKKDLAEKRQVLKDLYAKRDKIAYRSDNEEWKDEEKYKKLLKDYANYVKENKVVLLRQIEKGAEAIKNGEEKNGNGHIPEWKSHWTVDEQTQEYLEEMAENLKMQLVLNTGMLLLVGHTGTGKDVLLNMFCERTQRSKFDFDCSKWTTEFELSEDVVLQDGGVVPVPSKVLKAIQTPGSVLYFNEFNAMPESAQIFLHALLDEKRSLTLKTQSGKVVKAAEGILIAGSMNANYPGTFRPQFATRGRMVTQRIKYPPLKRERSINGEMQEVFDGSEAMRIAREVSSLKSLTEGLVAGDTAFMKLWDKEINQIDQELGFTPTKDQIFDLEVITAIIQFVAQLREHFIATIEKTGRGRNALKVEQPVSGRDLRNCAYALRQISIQDKVEGNLIPEKVARDLLERFFVEHIDDDEQRKSIVTAMTNWSVTKKR